MAKAGQKITETVNNIINALTHKKTANLSKDTPQVPVQIDTDSTGFFNHVVVGKDIAAFCENKTGAGGGRGGLISPEIGGDGGGNANCGVYIGGIDLRRGHEIAGGNGIQLQTGGFPLSNQSIRTVFCSCGSLRTGGCQGNAGSQYTA